MDDNIEGDVPGDIESRLRKAIRRLRRQHKLSQREVVARLGAMGVSMPRSSFSQLEVGSRHIDVIEINAIARALGIPLVDLFNDCQAAPEPGPRLQVTVLHDGSVEILQSGGRDGPALVAQLREIADTFDSWERIRVL